jgi:hypothetical protein
VITIVCGQFSYEVPYALADLVAMCRTWSRSYPAGSSEPSPRSVSDGIGAHVAAAHCDHHVEGFHRLEDLGFARASVDALSARAWTATEMIRIRCRHCSAPTGPTAITKPQRSIKNRFRWSIAKIGAPDHQPGRITFTHKTTMPSPLAHWLRSPSGADCRCRRSRDRGRLEWRRRQA